MAKKQTPIERALFGDKNTDYYLTDKKRWKAHMARSKAPVKSYPQWVTGDFNKADLKHGFMLADVFFQPMFTVFSNSLPLLSHVPKAEIDTFISSVGVKFLARGRKLDVKLTGFKHVKQGGLVNE